MRLGGLTSERVVRQRLDSILERIPLSVISRSTLPRGLFGRADPLTALEHTERAVEQAHPEYFPGPLGLMEVVDRSLVLELLIIQSIAGRQGRWAIRDSEVEDAKIGRELLRLVGPASPDENAAKLERARAAYLSGDHAAAVRDLVDVDRHDRTPTGAVQLALALWRLGQIPQALWAIRVALLEDLDRFELRALHHAQCVESSLRLIAEGRAAFGPSELACMDLLKEDLEISPRRRRSSSVAPRRPSMTSRRGL
ncbi:MAG: hypothetical protein U1E65_04980 [Myxococcota bacterium]